MARGDRARVDSGPARDVEQTGPTAKIETRGEGCAETPCVLRLPAGRYTLRLENPIAHLGMTTAVTVTADPGAAAVVRATLTRPL